MTRSQRSSVQHEPRFTWDAAPSTSKLGVGDGPGLAGKVEAGLRGSKEEKCRMVAKDIMARSGLQRELLFNGEGETNSDVDEGFLLGCSDEESGSLGSDGKLAHEELECDSSVELLLDGASDPGLMTRTSGNPCGRGDGGTSDPGLMIRTSGNPCDRGDMTSPGTCPSSTSPNNPFGTAPTERLLSAPVFPDTGVPVTGATKKHSFTFAHIALMIPLLFQPTLCKAADTTCVTMMSGVV